MSAGPWAMWHFDPDMGERGMTEHVGNYWSKDTADTLAADRNARVLAEQNHRIRLGVARHQAEWDDAKILADAGRRTPPHGERPVALPDLTELPSWAERWWVDPIEFEDERPVPVVEVFHFRDSDADCTVDVYLDGVEVVGPMVEDIDPGRDYDVSRDPEVWAERIGEVEADDRLTEPFRARVLNELATARDRFCDTVEVSE